MDKTITHTAKRLNSSSYYGKNFHEIEKLSLESVNGVTYTNDVNAISNTKEIMITNTHTDFSKISDEMMKNVELIIHPNSGYDNFPCEFVKNCTCPIILGNTLRSNAVSEWILSTIFSHYSSIEFKKTWSRNRKWDRPLIRDLSALIIGHGHIGKIVSSSLRPLLKNIEIVDPFIQTKDIHQDYSNLEMSSFDIVILSCGLNPTSRHLINEKFLKKLNTNVTIINAARGPLIKEDELKNFLSENLNAFAFLDVYEAEPNDFSMFSSCQNIKTSSHIAGVYAKLNQSMINFEKEIIKEFKSLDIETFKNKYKKILLNNRVKDNYII